MSDTDERRSIYRKTTLGILYNFGGKNLGFVLTFIFTIVIARHLGPSDYGNYSFYRNTAAFLALFTILGLDQTMNHFVPALHQSGEEENIRPLLRKGIGMSIAGIGCVSLLSIIVFFILPRYTDLGYEFSPEILLLFLGLIIAVTFSAIMKGVISGMFHQRFLNIVETGSVASKLLLTLLFFWIGLDIEGVLLAVVIAFAFPSIIYYHHIMKEFASDPKIELNASGKDNVSDQVVEEGEKKVSDLGMVGKIEKGEAGKGKEGEPGEGKEGEAGKIEEGEAGKVKEGEAGKNGEGEAGKGKKGEAGTNDEGSIRKTWDEMRSYAFIMIIFTASYIMLDNQIDIILLKFISSNSEAGYYNIAFRFAFINALVFIGAIDGVLVPTFTSLKKEESLHQKQALHSALKYTLFFLIPIALAGMMFSDQLVELIFEDEYSDSADMLRVFYGTLVLSMAISWPIRFLLVSTGHERRILRIYVLYAVLNVIGDLILIPRYDGIGAVIATGCTTWLIALHLLYEVRGLGMLRFPGKFAVKSLFSAGIAVVPFYFILDRITNLAWLVGVYLVFCGLYLILNYLMKGITREELLQLWNMVRERGAPGEND